MTRPADLLDTTERIAALLAEQGIQAMVIGAVAMAAHRYVRHTEDIELGVNVPVRDLATVAGSLRAAGLEVIFREPDKQDPLGGVIDITGDSGLFKSSTSASVFPRSSIVVWLPRHYGLGRMDRSESHRYRTSSG